jgi:hypothetical protein
MRASCRFDGRDPARRQARRSDVARRRGRGARELGGRRGPKVGHAGTLDPFATGLLLVLVGRATRVQRWLMALEKEYVARARFGWTSTTGDPEGELTETGRSRRAARAAHGVLRQRPPAYSAVKVGGPAGVRAGARGGGGRARRARGHRPRVHAPGARPLPDPLLGRDLRAHADRRPRRRLLHRAAADRDRAVPRRGRRGPSCWDWATSWPGSCRCDPGGRRRPPRGARLGDRRPSAGAGRGRRPTVLLRDADGPIALAEPRRTAGSSRS